MYRHLHQSKLVVVVLLALLLCSSCARTFIHEISRDNDLKLQQSNVLVTGNNNLALNEFVKTFNKNFKDKRAFVNEYTSLVSARLKTNVMFTNVAVDTSSRWDWRRSYSYSSESSKAIDSLITNCNSDYLLRIQDFEISNRIQTSTMMGGPGMPMTSSSTEFCIVQSRFELIDTKTKRVVMEFESVGEAGVIFFAFEAALRQATSKSIDHAIEYMRSGKVKFTRF
jgi:hypothetical protein